VLAVIGCGGEGGRPGVSTSESTVCDDVAAVGCYNMYQCCSESEIEGFLKVSDPRTEDECRDDVHTICERQIAAFEFSIKNKHVQFDASIMNACLKAIEAPGDACATIDSTTPWTAACMESAWVGAVATDGQCDFSYECATDNVCNASRKCAALPGDGMPCVSQQCASGLFCNIGTCRPLVADGGVCASSTQCQKGLFCDLDGTRTCTPVHAVGEPCTGNASCATNTCLPGTCAGISETCFGDLDCSAHCADDGSFCLNDGSCQIGTCSLTPTSCTLPTDCTGVDNTCVFPVKCLPAQCQGDVVCAEAHVAVDYCSGALNSLPLFGRRVGVGAQDPL
jgi:hypothetical protein